MTLTETVRHICYDSRSGCLYVEHIEGQISPLSNALIISEVDRGHYAGYIEVCSCDLVSALYRDGCEVGAVVARLVDMHNRILSVI